MRKSKFLQRVRRRIPFGKRERNITPQEGWLNSNLPADGAREGDPKRRVQEYPYGDKRREIE